MQELLVRFSLPHLARRMLTNCDAETGGVQWMCAGKGIIHAEMPMRTDEGVDPVGLQLWIDLPKQVRTIHFYLPSNSCSS